MLAWALTFLAIATISALFAFGGIAGAASSFIAQVLFFIFMVLFIGAIIARIVTGRS